MGERILAKDETRWEILWWIYTEVGVQVRQGKGNCNKHIPEGVSFNRERLIVVRIVIVDYPHSLVVGSLNIIRPEGTKSNR